MSSHLSAIAANLISAAIWALLLVVVRRFSTLRLGRARKLRTLLLATLIFVGTLFQLAPLFFLAREELSLPVAAILTVAGFSFPLCLISFELRRFWRVGVWGADETIQKGVHYSQALRLCKSQLSFLGTGAAKLTRDPEFEKALLRCRPDVPARFLLATPDGATLKSAAKRAGKMEDTYREVVLGSLRVLGDLKQRREVNLEVRFYGDKFPVWRLMLIDKTICLASYNLFGEGDGSQLPQLHVVRAAESRREVDSFYYPFERYFDQIWEKAKPWDFKSFL